MHGCWKILCGFTSSELDGTKVSTKVTKITSPNLPETNHAPIQLPVPRHDFEGENPPEPPPEHDGEDLFKNEGAPQNEGAHNEEYVPNNAAPTAPNKQPTRRSSRTWKPTMTYLESLQQEEIELCCIPVCLEALNYDGEEEEINECPMLVIARTDEDTMYWDQAMKQPDADKFLNAAFEEIKTHEENKHWEIVPIEDLPDDTPVLDPIWSMKRERRLKTNEVYKHKARLNIHGGQQEHGVNYWETYAPVVTWAAI
jgi:hypothetical protein